MRSVKAAFWSSPSRGLLRREDVDPIAGKDEACEADDLVDLNRHRAHPILDDRGQRRALSLAGDLGLEQRLVRLDRREGDALFARTCHFADRAERARRQRIAMPRDLPQLESRDLVAITQRTCGDDDGRRGNGRRRRGYPLLRGLALEPAISGGDRGAAEDDGKDNHDDGFETHGDLAILIGAGRESATGSE